MYVGLYTVTPNDAGTGGTEVSGGSYARQAITSGTGTWAAPAGSGTSNSADVVFPAATADWGTIKSAALHSAATAGTILYVLPMISGNYMNFAVSDTTNDDIVCPSHGFAAGNAVRFFAVGGTLPTGLVEDTIYYVIATGLTTSTFRVSATAGGTAVDITAVGSGEVAKDASRQVLTGDTLTFSAGSISIVEG